MANEKEIIAVTGATGNIGKYVVGGLIAKGFAPRAIVRKHEDAADWDAAGVEQKIADLGDVESLTKALDGAEKVFSLSPLVENFIEMGQVFIEAAKRAGVKRIVRSSSQGADENESILMWKWHGTVEKLIENSGLDWTFVQPSSFFQNYLGFAHTIKNQNAFYGSQGAGKVSLTDVRDIAAVAVVALTENKHIGKKYAVTGGESLSNQDIAEIFSSVLGHKINYVDVPNEEAKQQMLSSKMPEWLVNAVMELNDVGKAGKVAEVRSTVEEVTGIPPRTFRQFAEEDKAIFQ
jgi:uncharacterized protein YbjT (DUF2867 family)